MLKNIYTLILVLLFAGSAVAQADGKTVYKKYNTEGVVEFSDQPDKQSKPIHVPRMNTYKQKAFPKAAQQEPQPKSVAHYSQLSITSPVNDALVRDTGGKVTVTLKVNPSLNPADTIKIVLNNDEKTAITGKGLSQSFVSLNPGAYKLQAFIVNKEGVILIQSSPVQFFLKRSRL